MTAEAYAQARSEMAQLLDNMLLPDNGQEAIDTNLAMLQGIMDELVISFHKGEIELALTDAVKLEEAKDYEGP